MIEAPLDTAQFPPQVSDEAISRHLELNRYKRAHIPANLRGLRLGSFRDPELPQAVHDTCWRFVDSFLDRYYGHAETAQALLRASVTERRTLGRGLLLVGKPGRGKTTLACAVASEISLRHDLRIFYAPVADYCQWLIEKMRLHAAIERGQGTDPRLFKINEWLENVESLPLVVLDDAGKEHSSNWSAKELDKIIRRRHGRGLPTLLPTNVEVTRWTQAYGSATASFWHEAFEIVPMDGPDLRAA